MTSIRIALASMGLALFAVACTPPEPAKPAAGAVDEKRLLAADAEPGQWMSTGRNYEEQHFSPLAKITADNAAQLGLAWSADFDTNRGQESTPLFVDGVLYVSTAWSKVKAYDAKTGALKWAFDPEVPGDRGANACCDVVNRGVAAWNGKIYVGALDGRLIALDAATGKKVWEVETFDKAKAYTITGAPRVVKGKVLIGNGGAEYGVRGYLSAYDAETGKLAWRFFVTPNPEKKPDGAASDKAMAELANATWADKGAWKESGGGGTPWDAITYDPKSDLIYFGTGNGAPWNAEIRSPGGGDNLFLSSIVAVHPEDGSYAWHYQETPNETWDYTATAPIMVADLKIGGADRRVVMHAPKNGFFYVLDAKSGQLISAKPIIDSLNWASGVDMATGRPIQNPKARFDRTNVGAVVAPHAGGAHSWHPWSFNPQTGLVYIPGTDANMAYGPPTAPFKIAAFGTNTGVTWGPGANKAYDAKGAPKAKSEGFLMAWDPVAQKSVWRISWGERGRGGGTLSTAGGLLVQGNSVNKEFAVYQATDGKKLWSMPVQTGIVAAPITYEQDGEQYLAVTAGNNQSNYYASNHSRLLVFKLGGKAALPAPAPENPQPPLSAAKQFGDAKLIAAGEAAYGRSCFSCHGLAARNNGSFPDLRRSGVLVSADAFKDIVLDGARSANGMGSFRSVLSDQDAEAIRAYLIDRAQDAIKHPEKAGTAAAPT